MHDAMQQLYGNASSIHAEGARARLALDNARLKVARTLQVQPDEVFFTGSGTESNNLAISGVIRATIDSGVPAGDIEVITTLLEHPSVLEVLRQWEREGVVVHMSPLQAGGVIDVPALTQLLSEKTVLVTVAHASSEVGVVQPIRKIARAVRLAAPQALLHLDASQSPLWLSCNAEALGVDLMTLDAGKCNGPKGVGVLMKRKKVSLAPIQPGGGQERGVRAGTENIPSIIGAALAIERAQAGFEARAATLRELSVYFYKELMNKVPSVILNGPEVGADTRLPHNVHISLSGVDTEYAVVVLDAAGIAASTRSACSGAGGGQSAAVLALTGDTTLAASTIRFTLDPVLTKADLSYVATTLATHCATMQKVDRKAQ